MIKAVLFDLFQTLVRYEPPREETESRVLHEFGIDVSPEALSRPLVVADEFIYNEIARRPLSARTPEEVTALYVEHQDILLREAGIAYDKKLTLTMLGKMRETKMELVLFDDVAPALDALKKRGLILGMISNVEQDMSRTFARLRLTDWLQIMVTSQEAGANKPNPLIFKYALEKIGVPPSEALFVGDQYQVDVMGARAAGMPAVLIDRTGYYQDITECPRIAALTEVTGYL